MSHNWDAARNETLDMLSQAEQAVIEMESARAEFDRQKAAHVELLKEHANSLPWLRPVVTSPANSAMTMSGWSLPSFAR